QESICSRTNKSTISNMQSKVEDFCLSYLRSTLQKKSFSEKAISLVKEVSQQSLNNYLTEISTKDFAYNTIATYHTVISEVHEAINNITLKNILIFADPDTKAKNIRAISANLAHNTNASMNTLLIFKNWLSNEVYKRFYQKDMKKTLIKSYLSTKILDQAKK
ncbi:4343_t:CDS:2, partial [Racocetra persica]